MSDMLGIALRDVRGPLTTLLERLSGQEGVLWLKRLNRFNRGENPFAIVAGATFYWDLGQLSGARVAGKDMYHYLQQDGMLDRCFSHNDPLIHQWMDYPQIYPLEWRDEDLRLLLWGSVETDPHGTPNRVAYVHWKKSSSREVVLMGWQPLNSFVDEAAPALVRPLSDT